MEVTVTKANEFDIAKAEELFDLYIHEMSEYIVRKDEQSQKSSLYDKLFYSYWKKEGHFPLLIYCDEELAGFSLIRRYPSETDLYDMGQYFILDKFKRKGIGRKAFQLISNKFPGKWLVRILLANDGAFLFWKQVISEKTDGNYLVSKELDEGLYMHFLRYTI
jgi:predicted acetyltransferase